MIARFMFFYKPGVTEFWIDEVPFLVHVISQGGIAVDPSKVKDVLEWETLRQ